MIKKKFLNKIPIFIFLLFIFCISYNVIPFAGEILNWGDYPFFYPESSFNPLSTWTHSFLGNSSLPVMFGTPITGYLPTILFFLGFSQSLISYLLHFLPVLITCLLLFYIIKKISGNVLFAYFAGFFIILNNFILEQFVLWPGHFFYNIISLIILFYLTYEIYHNGLDWKKCVCLILNSLLILHPFFLIIYILYLFLFLVFYYFYIQKIKILLFYLVILIGILFIHLYWIVPLISNFFYQNVQNSYNGNQMSVLSGYISMVNYVNLFNYYNYPGSLSLKFHQGIWQYIFYFGLLSTTVFILLKKRIIKKISYLYIIFLISIFLIFFTLALGPNSKLTGDLWEWAFNNVFGFGFLRSFTRFLITSLISIIFIFAVFIKQWNASSKYKNIAIGTGIIFLILTNLIFFTGDLNGLIGTSKVPREYLDMNEKYFKKDLQKYNLTSYPNVPYEAYSWSINKNTKDFPQIIYFNLYFFSKPITYNGYAFSLNTKNDLFEKIFAHTDSFVFYPDFNNDLSSLNIKYILIRKDLFNILNINEEVEYKKYYQYFKHDPQYILKENNQYFALFENTKFQHLFGKNNIFFKNINPTKYKLYIKNIKSSQNLSFLESFHKGWKFYLRTNPTNSWCKPMEYYENTQTTECEHTQKFFEGEELSYLWKKPIFDNTHELIFDYANGWTINPGYIKQNFSKEYYRENPDGSIDVELTLYFKPQSYFYLGLFISGTTFLACLGYLGYDFYKRRKIINKNNE